MEIKFLKWKVFNINNKYSNQILLHFYFHQIRFHIIFFNSSSFTFFTSKFPKIQKFARLITQFHLMYIRLLHLKIKLSRCLEICNSNRVTTNPLTRIDRIPASKIKWHCSVMVFVNTRVAITLCSGRIPDDN